MPAPSESLFKRLLRFRLLFVVNLVFIGLLTMSFGREIVRTIEIQRDIAALQEQADTLQARHIEMTQLNAAFQTESFVEGEARVKLGMKKPGEEVVVVQRSAIPTVQAASSGTETGVSEGDVTNEQTGSSQESSIANPTKWWYYFFDSARFKQLSVYGTQ